MPVLALLRFDPNSHALVVKCLSFGEVENLEVHETNVVLVLNREVEPLMMASGIRIGAHVKLKLPTLRLDNHIEVSGLKVRIEYERLLPYIELSQ